MTHFSIRDREIRLIDQMIGLNGSEFSTPDSFADQWKILVYDNDSRDVISPLMNVGTLRQKGITLHLLLHSDREQVADAPAIYFIRPTEENINRVIQDCKSNLYRYIYLNFLTRIERPLLEKLAQGVASTNSVDMVAKIMDQYLDCVALEPSLFSLNISQSFVAYNAKNMQEAQIKSYIGKLSHSLLSTMRVLNNIPIIRAPTGGAAEMLANEFGSLMRENLGPRGAAQPLFTDALSMSSSSTQSRPLLLIFDRTSDMSPMLQHTATYQALVDDLLEHRLNRVTIEIPNKEKTDGTAPPAAPGTTNTNKRKTYDLNTQTDAFYSIYAGEPFPEAVEANERELAEVSLKEQEIRQRPSNMQNPASNENKGDELSAAIDSLPEILAKKANLEAHTNILQCVMSQIATREVPTYFEMESALLASGRIADKNEVLNLIRDGSKGSIVDKVRLLIIISLICQDVGQGAASVWQEYETAFVQGCAVMPTPPAKDVVDRYTAIMSYVRRLHGSNSKMSGLMSSGGASSYGSSNSSEGLSSFLTAAGSKASSLMAKATSFFTKFSPLYVTRVVDNLSEGRACDEADSYLLIDPKEPVSNTNVIQQYKNNKYSDVIVFIIGGGCYNEYFNLLELRKYSVESRNTLKNVLYGSTEIMNTDKFLEQLHTLATQ